MSIGPDVARRRLLIGLAALTAPSCRCAPPPPPVVGAWKELPFEPSAGDDSAQHALLLLPEAMGRDPASAGPADGAAGLPLLIALHGRGEAVRGPLAGARGWRDDYHLDDLIDRIQNPPLSPDDLGRMVRPERLALLNASLARHPYRGLCVATPFTPDLRDRSFEAAGGFGRFIVERLLPRVRVESGCQTAREATGIDGVSLGGRLALLVGLSHPEVFAAVGALQPAVHASEAEAFSSLARQAMDRAVVSLRLVSSDADPFLPAIRAISDRMRQDGVVHELLVVPGPHDYDWNRGPGGAEMLLWHERVQRGLTAP